MLAADYSAVLRIGASLLLVMGAVYTSFTRAEAAVGRIAGLHYLAFPLLFSWSYRGGIQELCWIFAAGTALAVLAFFVLSRYRHRKNCLTLRHSFQQGLGFILTIFGIDQILLGLHRYLA